MTTDELIAEFPDLTREDVRACLAYAADRERHTLLAPVKLLGDDEDTVVLVIC